MGFHDLFYTESRGFFNLKRLTKSSSKVVWENYLKKLHLENNHILRTQNSTSLLNDSKNGL